MPVESLTPYRKVEIEAPFVKGTWIDITRQLGSGVVTLTEETTGIDQLQFTIKHGAAFWIDNINEGMKVRLTAGYAVELFLQTTKRVMFEGVVSSFKPLLPDTGIPGLRITCMNRLFELTKEKPGRIAYPGIKIANHPPPYNRDFHFGVAMKISDIVQGILNEYGIPIKQIRIEPAHDYEFQLHNPISQNEDETDWDFIQRLLTGHSNQTRRRVRQKKVNHLVNARARLFMEVDPIEQRALATVAPEADLIADTNDDIRFVYQSPGVLSVDENEYDPTSNITDLMMRGASLSENKEDATGKEVQHRQDVKKGAKGRRSVGKAAKPTDPQNKGAQRKDVVSSGDGDKPPPDLAFNYRINEQLVAKDLKSGKLPSGINILSAVVSGQLKWKDVKKYFTPRQVANVPSGRTIPGAKPIPRQASTPTGFTGSLGKGSGGKGAKGTQGSGEVVQGARIKKYGQTLSFSTRGNLFVLCRKSYPVEFPFGRYTGNWFLLKLEHRIGETYVMQVEMGR